MGFEEMRPLAKVIELAANGNTEAHVPPQNLEAEEAVLGAMMVADVANDVFGEVRLEADDFYRERHAVIFRAVGQLHERQEPIDALTVSELLSQTGQLEAAGGREEVSLLASSTPAPGNARHYAQIVKENSLLRRLLRASQEIQQSVHNREGVPRELVEWAERKLFEVAHEEHTSDFQKLAEVLHLELEKLEELSKGDATLTGIPSGFRKLDELTGGFQRDNLIVIAARPSMGKSSLVCNIAENVAVKGLPVAFFSLEMSQTELAHRFIASQARIPGDRLRKGQVAQRDWPGILRASNKLNEAPLWLDDSADLGLLDLRAKARRLHSQEIANGNGGLAMIVVDYVQLMRAEDPRQNRVEQVGQISRGLKLLARELRVPVIALSQLSRAPEQRPDKRPILSDLRESGNIEQDADVVAFIYRDEVYNKDSEFPGEAELIIRKHRNGPIDTVRLAWLPQFPKFATYTGGERPVEQRPGEGPPMAEAAV
jgi:replicative DNA helicase